MKKVVTSLLRQFFFWMLFFAFTRFVFLIYYLNIIKVEKIKLSELLAVFPHAIKLDVATTCYFLVFPFFLLCVQAFYNRRWLDIVNKVYSAVLITGYSLTAAGEMGIYAEWKTKLTYKVIKYLSRPDEIFNSAETGTFFILIFLFLLITAIGIFAYNKLFYVGPEKFKVHPLSYLAFLIIPPGILFIGLRGGVQQIPINQSESYFSDHNILNVAAVNNGFNLYISIFENLANFEHDPYVFMDSKKAAAIMKGLYSTPSDTTISILNTQRPNIVLLILESWSADLIEALGGEP